jgi:hypothetical protein
VTTSIPNENAEGNLTWNPSVGLYHEPAKVKRESYGGIIGALQDQIVKNSGTTRAYPENFAGIIAAIQDLNVATETPPVDIGPKPPGGEIIIDIDGNPEWIITEKPADGTLWFDTRQGRTFVWIDSDWYQTNGGDGIPIVTADGNPPSLNYAVPGQLWYDRDDNNLFIFNGQYQAADGTINEDGDGQLIWKLVADLDQDFIQTTATLPLAAIGPKVKSLEDYTYLPDPDISGGLITVQKDYNEWVFQSLVNLDVGLETLQPVLISDTPPPSDDPDKPLVAGQLWYDTETLELSIWYVDDDSAQWVPTSVAYAIDEQLLPLQTALATETRLREQAIHTIQLAIQNFDIADNAEIAHLGNLITALEAKVDKNPVVDMTGYVTSDEYSTSTSQLIERLVSLETATPDYSSLMSKAEAEAEHTALEAVIASKATPADVAEVAAQIPDVSNFLVQQDVVDAIANITTEYLPRTGGVLTGSFRLQKNDYGLPGLDFSGASWYSRKAFQLTANAPVNVNTTFGTTDNPWEYAWEFGADEDFCWIYNDTNKVFSITKEGPACSTLYLGDIGDNTNNGRVIHNKIDVKERLNTYQTAFESIRQAVSSSTDYASLKSGLLTALANV